jgi:chitinase
VGGDYGGTTTGGTTTGGTTTGGTTTGGTTTGGNGGDGGTNGSSDEGKVVITHGGCSLASGGDTSSFAAFLVGALALLSVGRRRASKR